jgi:hypothetical protein
MAVSKYLEFFAAPGDAVVAAVRNQGPVLTARLAAVRDAREVSLSCP